MILSNSKIGKLEMKFLSKKECEKEVSITEMYDLAFNQVHKINTHSDYKNFLLQLREYVRNGLGKDKADYLAKKGCHVTLAKLYIMAEGAIKCYDKAPSAAISLVKTCKDEAQDIVNLYTHDLQVYMLKFEKTLEEVSK